MASGMASAATHQISPMALPAIPRVRPPRMLKGTPQPNTLPIPTGEVPKGKVWVDGQWRLPQSKSAKHKQEIRSRQIEKALRHETHGMNIYAYSHVRTNQVVYSLTKVMQNNKILPQLLYHGKKTVPAALRRDVWRPYFSVHFPQTPAGALKGLRVYQELRELAMRRQLDPPEELVAATKEDLESTKRRIDPITLKEQLQQPRKKKIKLPIPGQKLPKKLRARRLMDQKATSVADVAAVLALHARRMAPNEWLQSVEKRRMLRAADLSKRARTRLNEIRRAEDRKVEQIEARKELVLAENGNLGQMTLDRHASSRISMEYEGVFNAGQVMDLQLLKTKQQQASQQVSSVARQLQELILQRDKEISGTKTGLQKRLGAAVEENMSTMTAEARNSIDEKIKEETQEVESRFETRRQELFQEFGKQCRDLEDSIQVAETWKEKAEKEEPSKSESAETNTQIAEKRRELKDLKATGPNLIERKLQNEKSEEMKYLGPYKDMRSKIDQVLGNIHERYQPRIGALQRELDNETHDPQTSVEVRWADIRAATFAREWPQDVVHDVLAPKAAIKRLGTHVQTHSFIDEDEHEISEQQQTTKVQVGSSVHVFGSVQSEDVRQGWYISPTELNSIHEAERVEREGQWETTEPILARKEILNFREKVRAIARGGSINVTEEESEIAAALSRALESAQASLPPATGSLEQTAVAEQQTQFQQWIESAKELIPDVEAEMARIRKQAAGYASTDANKVQDQASLMDRMSRLTKYAEALIQQLEFESKYAVARLPADRYEDWQQQLVQRKSLLQDSVKSQNDPEQYALTQERLAQFDDEHPDVFNLERTTEELEAALQAREQDIVDAEQELLIAENAVNEAQAKYTTVEANLSTSLPANATAEEKAKAESEMATLKRTLDDARENATTAQDTLEDLQEQQVRGQENLARADRDAWLQFKRKGSSPRSSTTPVVDEADVEIPSEQQRGQGLWAKIRGLFGR